LKSSFAMMRILMTATNAEGLPCYSVWHDETHL